MSEIVVISGFFFLISLLLRSVIIYFYRDYFKAGKSGDASGHLIIIRQFKKNFFSKRIDQFALTNRMHYAVGFHKYASFFSESTLVKRGYLPSLLIFSIFSSLFFTATYIVSDQNIRLTAITMLVFIASASNVIFFGKQVTNINLSERLMAKMTAASSFFFMLLFLQTNNQLFFIISVVCCALNLLSSTFGRQVQLFVIPLFSIVTLSYFPILIFVTAFVCATILQPTYFLNSFSGTIKYWKITKAAKESTFQSWGLNYLNINIVIDNLKKLRLQNLINHLYQAEPTRVLFYFPTIIGSVILLTISPNILYIQLYTAAIIVYSITTTYRFAHVGEGYRYIEYTLYMVSSYVFADLLLGMGDLIYPILIAYLIYNVFVVRTIIKHNNGKLKFVVQEDHLTRFLENISLNESDTLYTINSKVGLDIASRINVKVFWWQCGGFIDVKVFEEYWERYPYWKKDWTALFKKHSATHVIVDKTHLEKSEIDYDFSRLKLIYQDDYFIAYKIV
tara:strand:+ start:1421 stop:2938 length:1518 start_codon:yes stop_codon:yes gene_type:complete